MESESETIEQFRKSFYYGSRSDHNFKFLKDLSDDEFGLFVQELLEAISQTTDDGDSTAAIDAAYRWQITAYAGHLGDPGDFPHGHDDVPIAHLSKPLSECRVALLTSSGHFVAGDDPKPFGVENMTQAEASKRIGEFVRETPQLSLIPTETPVDQLCVRHGGYAIDSVAADPEVALPLGHMKAMVDQGVIGELSPNAYSFVGATSQVRLRKQTAPAWAEMLRDEAVDAVLLVPV